MQGEGVEQEAEQHVSRGPPTPGGAVEDAVVVDEPPFPSEPGDPQNAGDGALARRQDRAEQ